MHYEFALQYEIRWMKRFGLNYANRWEKALSRAMSVHLLVQLLHSLGQLDREQAVERHDGHPQGAAQQAPQGASQGTSQGTPAQRPSGQRPSGGSPNPTGE